MNMYIAFAFGTPSNIRSNTIIKQKVQKLLRDDPQALFFVQRELDVAQKHKKNIVTMPNSHNRPPSTLQIILSTKEWLMTNDYSDEEQAITIALIAAPQHIQRCMRDTKVIFPKAEITACAFVNIISDDVFYDKNSQQWRTRFKRVWQLRENILLALPWWLYRYGKR